MPTAVPWHRPEALDIYTYTPDNEETLHPSVVDFGGKWNGYRFWMVHTPYPKLDGLTGEDWENPSVAASNDCLTWTPIGRQPLWTHIELGVGYNSDPEIEWDPDRQRLNLWFRPGAPPEGGPYFYTWTTNGTDWAEPVSTAGYSFGISPMVLRLSMNHWRMWYVKAGGYTYRDATNPMGPWSVESVATTNGQPITGVWHAGMTRNPETGRIYTIVGYSKSPGVSDDNGETWRFGEPLDYQGVYRPTMVLHENGTHMRIWDNHPDPTGERGLRIGYMEIPLSMWPA